MGSITIRNLDDRVIDAWKARAKTNHRSLEAELRYVLTRTVNRRRHMAEFRERTDRIAGATAEVPQTDSADLIREDRERAASVREGDLSRYLDRAPDAEPEAGDELPR